MCGAVISVKQYVNKLIVLILNNLIEVITNAYCVWVKAHNRDKIDTEVDRGECLILKWRDLLYHSKVWFSDNKLKTTDLLDIVDVVEGLNEIR